MTHPIDIRIGAGVPREALSARAGVALALFGALAGAALLATLQQGAASGWPAAAGLLLAASSVAIAGAVAMHRRSRSLDRVAAAMQRLAAGEFDARVSALP